MFQHGEPAADVLLSGGEHATALRQPVRGTSRPVRGVPAAESTTHRLHLPARGQDRAGAQSGGRPQRQSDGSWQRRNWTALRRCRGKSIT